MAACKPRNLKDTLVRSRLGPVVALKLVSMMSDVQALTRTVLLASLRFVPTNYLATRFVAHTNLSILSVARFVPNNT